MWGERGSGKGGGGGGAVSFDCKRVNLDWTEHSVEDMYHTYTGAEN